MLAQTTLRNILGTRTLSGVLSERDAIAYEMIKILDEATDPWGKSINNKLQPCPPYWLLAKTLSLIGYQTIKVSLWNE